MLAQLALARRLEDLLGMALPLEPVVEDAEAWERGVDELASEDPEVADYVQQLEEAKDTVDLPEATGDAIARAGAIGNRDMTLEATYAKVQFLLSQGLRGAELSAQMGRSIAGELTESRG